MLSACYRAAIFKSAYMAVGSVEESQLSPGPALSSVVFLLMLGPQGCWRESVKEGEGSGETPGHVMLGKNTSLRSRAVIPIQLY